MACQATDAEEWKISPDLLCSLSKSYKPRLLRTKQSSTKTACLSKYDGMHLKKRQIDSSEALSLNLLRNFSRGHTVLVNNVWFKIPCNLIPDFFRGLMNLLKISECEWKKKIVFIPSSFL